jgi:alpha-ketoglutarate-dependent taurine dioxygenase
LTKTELSPFGLILTSETAGQPLAGLLISDLKGQIEEHRVVVLRGFAGLSGDAFPEYCRQFGEILEWEFGMVNHLQVKDEARNYLYTNHAVPFHWDGAFLPQAPHYIIFHCDDAPDPDSGGETLFCDTTLILDSATTEQQELWRGIEITYTTEKVVHYGGTFTSPMVAKHPFKDQLVLRFAEPVDDINPVQLVDHHLNCQEQDQFIKDMSDRLSDQRHCYSHNWQSGDVVVADNFTLLHGRRSFQQGAARNIRRVNVL